MANELNNIQSAVFRNPIQTQRTPLSEKGEIYSDFFNDFLLNPISGDLAKTTNEDAIKQSIRNLILTGRGERQFQPIIGSDIYQMLFENVTVETVALLETLITDTIQNFEPRCELLEVKVTSLIDSNDLNARIVFRLINTDNEVEFNTNLTRIR